MKNNLRNGTVPQLDEYLNYEDLSRFLKLGVRTLRNWKSAGKLTYCKIGGTVLFPRREIEKMLRRNTVKATQISFEEFIDRKYRGG